MMTSPMSFASIPARAMASRMTTAPRSAAERSFKAPPNDPIGVRHALRMTARSKPDSSCLQFGTIAKMFERVGVRERLAVLHRPAVNDVPHGQLDDLTASGTRDVADLDDARGNVAGRRVFADPPPDA